MKLVLLWTDAAVLLLVVALAWYARKIVRTPHLSATWRRALMRPSCMAAAIVLAVVAVIGLLDSIHYRTLLPATQKGAPPAYSAETRSVLDALLDAQARAREKTYSAPLAYLGFQKESIEINGERVREYPRLAHGGAHLTDPERQWMRDVAQRILGGAVAGCIVASLIAMLVTAAIASTRRIALNHAWQSVVKGATAMPVRTALITITVLCIIAGPIAALAPYYHVFGTDRVGNDLLYVVLKSIRTALVIGTMTTLVTLPLAVGLGILSGYVRGWLDEAVQYVYTVINSIPYVLLIAAAVLILQTFIDNHAELFQTSAERTDARLFFLCVILGLLSWTELCRLIRGETMKLRELDYVQAAQAFGVNTWRILTVHLLPNVMHLVLIYVVISFSSLVLAEAVLSYVGVGVDPAMQSFGTLINTARFELARQPSIWWTLATAFTFMFTIVLAANIFADAVRDAFDPKAYRS
ncbi:MAG TPA: ABC transporter permease [Burkholderiaceae bacterium]|nr:ABC transporter permease [Burkholderiaceae bacterium]